MKHGFIDWGQLPEPAHERFWQAYLEVTLGLELYLELPRLLGMSPHICTKNIKNNPEYATNDQLVRIAALLRRSPWELYEQYGLGRYSLTPYEAWVHWLLHQCVITKHQKTYVQSLEEVRNAILAPPPGDENQGGSGRTLDLTPIATDCDI